MGIASYLFGKIADFSIGSLLDNFDIKDKKEKKALEKFIEVFKKELLSRHKENPDFEQIEKFWKDQDVVGELFKIYYLRTSSYENYPQFKTNLKKLDYEMNSDLCFSLMDQFANQLKNTIVELSGNTKSMVSAQKIFLESMDAKLDMLLTKQDEEELRSNKQNNLTNGQVVAKENESMAEKVGESELDIDALSLETENILNKKTHLASSSFFSEKFDMTFFEVTRDFTIYTDKKIIQNRLEHFFENINYSRCSPLRKVRGSSYEDIFKMTFDDNGKLLLKSDSGRTFEILIDKVVAFNPLAYWQRFLLIQVDGDSLPIITGDSDKHSSDTIALEFRYSEGCYYEHTIGNERKYLESGLLCEISGDVEYRVRYLKNYNFLVVPRYHPLACDFTLYHEVENCLDKLLSTESMDSLKEIYSEINNKVKKSGRTLSDSSEPRYVSSYY
ncbi:hypothetical protein [Streptococcus suis]|uniref:hypothetical protein n=1 Tax=Streptococcus suis TaxID=1307 RepID=UPI00129045A8|nr:hypothetical protein [Streptococcus suis]